MADTAGPNRAQAVEWSGSAVDGWVRHDELLGRFAAGFGRAAMDRLDLAAGHQVLDVGCGTGATTLELAARVAPDGVAIGVDLSPPLLDVARGRAARAGCANVRFEEGDVQTAALPPVDAAFSRMGVMFFDDPVAAFANVAGALRPGGRLAFACWQEPGRNPWLVVPLLTAAAHLPVPPPPPPGAPGPFSLADPDRAREVLAAAGFDDVRVDASTAEVIEGADAATFAEVILSVVPPLAEGMAAADAATRARVSGDVTAALAQHEGPDGVRLPSAAWIVSARRA